LAEWNEVYDKLSQQAKYTKVKRPSQVHINKIISPILWKKIEGLLIKPKAWRLII
jgi:hypothetical protein